MKKATFARHQGQVLPYGNADGISSVHNTSDINDGWGSVGKLEHPFDSANNEYEHPL